MTICLNCGCPENAHPIDRTLTQHYGEVTRGACMGCDECTLFDCERTDDYDDMDWEDY